MTNLDNNLSGIIDHLITTADLICLDNSVWDARGDKPKDVARFCLGQMDDSRPDLGVRAILKEHGLAFRHLNFLNKHNALTNHNSTDAVGCMIDDRCLHVQLRLDAVVRHATISASQWLDTAW